MEFANLSSRNVSNGVVKDEPKKLPRNDVARSENPTGTTPQEVKESSSSLLYGIETTPPWYSVLGFALQQAMMCALSSMAAPLVISNIILCEEANTGLQAEMFSTSLLVAGIATLLQCTIGVRLPIVQGSPAIFAIAVLSITAIPEFQCNTMGTNSSSHLTGHNNNVSRLNTTSEPLTMDEPWRPRLLEIQGCLMLASSIQVLLGLTGTVGFLVRFIGPLTIVPVLVMISLHFFKIAGRLAEDSWGIWALTVALMFLFGVYLRNVTVPLPSYSKDHGWSVTRVQIFVLLPILFAVTISWAVCAILTVTDVFPDDPSQIGYKTRTDIKLNALSEAKWISVSYPGKYGMPTISIPGVLAMLAVTISSILESIGDYHIAAQIVEMPAPPPHAINRGIMSEGISGVIAGALGTGHSTTSYSSNIGVIRITKVASLRVFQVVGVILILFGILGKLGAILAIIPVPIQGGLFTFTISLIGAAGLSGLDAVDMKSSRNLAILGFSLFSGLVIPEWVILHRDRIETGNQEANNIIYTFLASNLFIAGMFGFILDNTVSGTLEERGMARARTAKQTSSEDDQFDHEHFEKKMKYYEWPFVTTYLQKWSLFRYIPCCPTFTSIKCLKCKCNIMSKTKSYNP